jgi:hypothetical protein
MHLSTHPSRMKAMGSEPVRRSRMPKAWPAAQCDLLRGMDVAFGGADEI